MTDIRPNLEVIAPSIDEAIEKGLTDLGLSRDDVEIEVLDEGSRGLFGLRARQARIRLNIKLQEDDKKEKSQQKTEEKPPSTDKIKQLLDDEGIRKEDIRDEKLQISQDTVKDLLEKMKVRAQVTSRYGKPDDARSKSPILVEIQGKDLSILIGRRAETLNAIQYIARLIVAKEIGRSIPLVVDVEGYRARREQQLRRLASRIAEQVSKTGRRHSLEPMSAYERRYIHIELRDNPDVFTESTGEEPRRRVNIIPRE